MLLTICHCGNLKNNHQFLHKFEPLIPVKKIDNTFVIVANNFKKKVRDVCGFPNCNSSKILHDEKNINKENNKKAIDHDYVLVKEYYREVNFVIPRGTKCLECGKNVEKHEDIQHPFITKIEINNLNSNDVIYITDPEYNDIHISW